MLVRFWGVRGGIACPGPKTARYGGNTPCVEVRCGNHVIVFDAGTGLRELGNALISEGFRGEITIFLTHFHLDHICGLPFFAPGYVSGNRMNLWAAHLSLGQGLEKVIRLMMGGALFPVTPDAFKAKLKYHEFAAGKVLTPYPGLILRTASLTHPGGAVGYRLEYAGRSVAYLTDTEHMPGVLDPGILALASNADLMIYDSMYTDDEFDSHRGWGHSTWRHGVELATAANAGTLVPFHHDPTHDDDIMDRIAAEAEAARPGTRIAREGMTVVLEEMFRR